MASCKDCVHVEVCCEKNLHVAVGMNIIPRFKYKRIEQECKNFKDRSRFVELPCKLGDTLFVPTRNLVSEYKVVSFHVCGEGIWYRTNVIKGILTRLISDNVENIGKTVFLTREEAEQALKERENYAE